MPTLKKDLPLVEKIAAGSQGIRFNAKDAAFIKDYLIAIKDNTTKTIGELCLTLVKKAVNSANNPDSTNDNTARLQEDNTKLLAEVSELKAEIQKNVNEVIKDITVINRLNGELHDATTEIAELKTQIEASANATKIEFQRYAFPESFDVLKTELESALPKIFKSVPDFAPKMEGVEVIPVTDEEALRLLVDYAKRDPSKEFPFLPIAKEIVENFLTTKTP